MGDGKGTGFMKMTPIRCQELDKCSGPRVGDQEGALTIAVGLWRGAVAAHENEPLERATSTSLESRRYASESGPCVSPADGEGVLGRALSPSSQRRFSPAPWAAPHSVRAVSLILQRTPVLPSLLWAKGSSFDWCWM